MKENKILLTGLKTKLKLKHFKTLVNLKGKDGQKSKKMKLSNLERVELLDGLMNFFRVLSMTEVNPSVIDNI